MNCKQGKLCEVAGFISKLHSILQDDSLKHIIEWSQDGNSFTIKILHIFQHQVLTHFFRHKRLTSFIRQLNMYGFHKTRGDPSHYQFTHQLFKKDHPQLYHLITRKKTSILHLEFLESKENYTEKEIHAFTDYSLKLKSQTEVGIEPSSNQQLKRGSVFRLNGSEMTIRLNIGLTSLANLEDEEELKVMDDKLSIVCIPEEENSTKQYTSLEQENQIEKILNSMHDC